jgi:hypothetical protein
MYGRLNWGYTSRSDLNYNIKIGSNRVQYVVSEEKEHERKLKE